MSNRRNAVLLFVLIIAAMMLLSIALNNENPTSKPKTYKTETYKDDPKLTAVAEPSSGTVLSGQKFKESQITVTAPSNAGCVVKLKTIDGDTRLMFYVRAGQTVTVGVPAEYLYVYFACGSTWYGKQDLFGAYTSYSKDDKVQDFMHYTWTYTLKPVTNGNFSETPVTKEEFFA